MAGKRHHQRGDADCCGGEGGDQVEAKDEPRASGRADVVREPQSEDGEIERDPEEDDPVTDRNHLDRREEVQREEGPE